MSDFLDEMARGSRERARALAPQAGELQRRAEALDAPSPLVLGDLGVIAEIKPRAPSAGRLSGADLQAVESRALAYARGRACCVSVLTEPTRFDGSMALLEALAGPLEALDVPVMRKDFLVEPVQIAEARVAGASGVLLITRMLDDALLAEMIHAAQALRMFVLVESFDEEDLARTARALAPSPTGLFVGVNCRDLRTLAIERPRLEQLARMLPAGVDAVAESGIESLDHVREAVRAGYRGVLVGTSLMRASDPSAAVLAMRDAGRAASREDPPCT